MSEPQKALRSGRYTLVRVLGEGGQAETFEAIDNGIPKSAATEAALADRWHRYVASAREGGRSPAAASLETAGRLVAIKKFRVGQAKAWKDVELAEREARTLASLDHPRLPKYIEHFEEDGALYLVMEKVEGESLASLRKRRVLGPDDVVRMLEDMADALRYLHGLAPAVVHRDIKPSNIIRRPDGSFALVDFGAVRDRLKPAGGSTVVGTFGYMAPEQFQGRASPTSDVYALAATALAVLTGEEPEDLPHEGLGIDVARALPKRTPSDLVRALSSMLVPDPDRRAGSVDEALARLRRAHGKKVEPGAAERHRRPSRGESREDRRERKRRSREERRRRRAIARARAAPFALRVFGHLGLVVASLAVWVSVGFIVPLVLTLLAALFGAALMRAAGACVGAARRAQSRIRDAHAWLAGTHAEESTEDEPRFRVPEEPTRTRVHQAEQDPVAEDLADDLEASRVSRPHRRTNREP